MKKAVKIILASFIAASLAVSSASYAVYAAPGDDQGSSQGSSQGGGTDSGSTSGPGDSSTGVPGGTGGGGGSSSDWESEGGLASNTINEDGTYTGGTYKATEAYYTALYIDGATVTLIDATVEKTGGSQSGTDKIESTDACDFYGVNAALLVRNGAVATISNLTLTSDAYYGNGVYCYGESIVYISDSKITTQGNHSGGIMVTGGGTLYATNLEINTSGTSSAAIRTDKGGGTVVVDGGTYITNGNDSPAVYSTADITVSNATLTANSSQAIVVEGNNSVTLNNCVVSGTMRSGTSSGIDLDTVMIYQSQSGDADSGTSSYTQIGGQLINNNGNVFYVTNTDCEIYLESVDIENLSSGAKFGDYLMRIVGNDASHGWGTAGKNGATVDMTTVNQVLEGDIVVDKISCLDLSLTEGSSFTGTINIIDNAEGGTDIGENANVYIDSSSTWTLTGDCTLSSITCDGTINYDGHTITLEDGTVYSESNPVPGSTVGTDDSSSAVTTTSSDDQSSLQTTETKMTSDDGSSSGVDGSASGSGDSGFGGGPGSGGPDGSGDGSFGGGPGSGGPDGDDSSSSGQSTTDVTDNDTTSTETVPEPITTETSDDAQQTGSGNIPDGDQQGQHSGETITTATTPVQSEAPSTPSEGVVYGDISLDNSIDMGDVVLIARYTAGLFTPQDNQQILNADCNNDGSVDWTDVNILVNFNLGVINVLPYIG